MLPKSDRNLQKTPLDNLGKGGYNGVDTESKRNKEVNKMTIGELLDILDNIEGDTIIENVDLADYGSDRGDYSKFYVGHLSTDATPTYTVSDLIDLLLNVVGHEFCGYKGGWFLMTGDTDIRLGMYSCCGDDIIDVQATPKGIILNTENWEEVKE